jgi:hypothetical protein
MSIKSNDDADFSNFLRGVLDLSHKKTSEIQTNKATNEEQAKLKHHESLIDKIEEIWERTETNNNKHRTNIVGVLFSLIVLEIVVISVFIFMSPFVKFPNYVIEIFSTAVIAQTFGLVTIMLKYLFNNKDDKFLEAISNIYKSNFTKDN